jgi:hypothetical protein
MRYVYLLTAFAVISSAGIALQGFGKQKGIITFLRLLA